MPENLLHGPVCKELFIHDLGDIERRGFLIASTHVHGLRLFMRRLAPKERAAARPVLFVHGATLASYLWDIAVNNPRPEGGDCLLYGGDGMKSTRKRKTPEIVFREGKPTAVILDINEYQEMLERLEDMEDLKLLENMRRKPLRFRSLDDFLKEYTPGV